MASELILVIEDDDGIRDGLEELLRSEGYRVAFATNGAEGIERWCALRPNLVLLDLMMPVMDGFAYLAAGRRDHGDAFSRTPTIILTAAGQWATTGTNVRAIVAKPINIDKLLSTISSCLQA